MALILTRYRVSLHPVALDYYLTLPLPHALTATTTVIHIPPPAKLLKSTLHTQNPQNAHTFTPTTICIHTLSFLSPSVFFPRNQQITTMALSTFLSLLFLFLFVSLLLTRAASLPPSVGVNYIATSNPAPAQLVVAALQNLKITSVRLPKSTPALVRAFSNSNISLLLSVPNELVMPFAANRSSAALWLQTHVVPFYPSTRISTISVGTDVLVHPTNLSQSLVPAIRNFHHALHDLGITDIAVSTTFTFRNVISNPYPPSNAQFEEEPIIKALLQFLKETNSSFLINLYPYKAYRVYSADEEGMPVGFPLFEENPHYFEDDLETGLQYRNLFDRMVDCVIWAMKVAGHKNIPVVVTETGWPSSGDRNETAVANPKFAEKYVKGLIIHLKSGVGTPLRKKKVVQTYLYELFDRGSETGGHNWGILYPNMTQKYAIGSFGASPAPAPSPGLG